MYRLEEETEDDGWEVEALYDLCFAPGRTALSSYRLRDGVPTVAALCLILRDDDGTLAAAIRYWPAEVAGEDVLLLGPVPTPAVAYLTNGRFGFEKLDGVEMPPPTNPDRVLGLALKQGAWAGVRGAVTKATGV